MTSPETHRKTDDRNLWITLGIAAGLWPIASLTLLFVIPDIAWHHYAWLGFLFANLVVWPSALVAAAVKEAAVGLRVMRTRADPQGPGHA